MVFKYCTNCTKKTGHKRAFGAGTVIGVILTLGLWAIVMPVYPIRCMICGNESQPHEDEGSIVWPIARRPGPFVWLVVSILLLLVLSRWHVFQDLEHYITRSRGGEGVVPAMPSAFTRCQDALLARKGVVAVPRVPRDGDEYFIRYVWEGLNLIETETGKVAGECVVNRSTTALDVTLDGKWLGILP